MATISMVAPAIMLLGIQPGDKLGIRLAAAFLSILCGYYFIFLISSPSNWATPFAQVRAVVLIFIEWFWGCLFLRAAKLRVSAGGSRENLKEGQLAFGRTTYFFMGSSRAALDWLWFAWRASVLSFSTVDLLASLIALIWQASTGYVHGSGAQPEPEGETPTAEPEGEPENEPPAEPENEPSPENNSTTPEPENEPVVEPSGEVPVPEGEPESSGGTASALPEPFEPSPEPTITLEASPPATTAIVCLLALIILVILSKKNRARVHGFLTRWDHDRTSRLRSQR